PAYIFLCCPADLRALPSFPTRRSSDLSAVPLKPVDELVSVASSRLARVSFPEPLSVVKPLKSSVYEPSEYVEGLPNDILRRLVRSEEHTSELQSPCNLVCRLLLEKKNK